MIHKFQVESSLSYFLKIAAKKFTALPKNIIDKAPFRQIAKSSGEVAQSPKRANFFVNGFWKTDL